MKYSNDIENFKTEPTLYKKCNWYYNIILSIVLCFKHNSQTLCRHRKINIVHSFKARQKENKAAGSYFKQD